MNPYCAAPGCHDPRTYLYAWGRDHQPVTVESRFTDGDALLRFLAAATTEPERVCRIHARQAYGVSQTDTLPASHKCPLPEVADGHWICAGCGREWWADGDRWRLDPPF